MNKKKILSLIMALVMLVGVFSPLTAFAGGSGTATEDAKTNAGTVVAGKSETEQKIDVTLHKIKLTDLSKVPTQKDKENFIEGLAGDPKEKYVGREINNIKNFFDDQKAEELAGVKFTYWVFNDEAKYKKMIENAGNYATVADVDKELGTENVTKKEITSVKGGKKLDQITVPANENRFIWVIETSSVIPAEKEGEEEQTITGMKAVPFGLALPLFNADGSVNTDIHVYPKNTTANEPKVDKDFEGKANAKQDREEITNNIVEDAYVGQVKNYDIETIIPEGAKYKTVAWTDQMTEGLTFNNDVKIMIGAKDAETEWDAANYKVTKDNNGFVLELTPAGLKALEEKAKTGEFRLLVKYSATVNEKAKVDRQERNDVVFHFGNEPHHGNTPYPTKPSNGSLTVNKEFSDARGAWKPGEKVEVTIYDAHTGKPVDFKDNKVDSQQKATVILQKGDTANNITEKLSHTWKGLDNDKQYKVVEKFTPGDEVTYVKQKDNTVKIIDEKTDNPNPKDPQEPGVIVYGHRFQKVDQEGKGLVDAKFVVRNNIENDANKGKVLAQKEAKDIAADQAAYVAAEKAYKDAVKEGKADTEIAPLKEARDKAYVTVNTQWKWIDDTDKHTGAYVFTSGTDGYFKVTGLQKGAYELVETEAPKGYAKLTSPVPFTIGADSTGATTKLETGKLQDEKGFTQVENKKVTIPQTGGIGTVLFTVVGIGLMAGAVMAMKKNREEA